MPISAPALTALTRYHWYDVVASMLRARLAGGDTDDAIAEACRLASVAQRVLALDAEDFTELAEPFERPWAERMVESCFPAGPRDAGRGALASLVPLYELMLEVIDLRSERHEPQQIVVTAHLIGEYLPQLAWETTLGHGGDPLALGRYVGERWGTDDPACPHSSAMRSTARRALHAANGDKAGYTSYLDKFHSRLGDTLAVCGMNHATVAAGERPDVGDTCPNPCTWAVRGSMEQRRSLDARLRLALIYLDSPLVALRHHAPVGHFFGVPSTAEISDAWIRTWTKLTAQWADGENPLVGRTSSVAKEALPGLSMLISTVADMPVQAGHLLADIGDDITAALSRAAR